MCSLWDLLGHPPRFGVSRAAGKHHYILTNPNSEVKLRTWRAHLCVGRGNLRTLSGNHQPRKKKSSVDRRCECSGAQGRGKLTILSAHDFRVRSAMGSLLPRIRTNHCTPCPRSSVVPGRGKTYPHRATPYSGGFVWHSPARGGNYQRSPSRAGVDRCVVLPGSQNPNENLQRRLYAMCSILVAQYAAFIQINSSGLTSHIPL